VFYIGKASCDTVVCIEPNVCKDGRCQISIANHNKEQQDALRKNMSMFGQKF
jgi:hypothetical protein